MNSAAPPLSAQRRRDSGVDSTISSRPDVSSDAQPATSVTAARPPSTMPNSMKSSCRKPPTVAKSMPGNDRVRAGS